MALISVGWWLSTVVVCFFFSNKLLRSTSFALIFYFCLLFFFSICWLNMRFVFCVWMFLVVSSVLIFPFAYLPFYFTLSLFVSLLCIQYNRGNIVILFMFFFLHPCVCTFVTCVCVCVVLYIGMQVSVEKNEDGTPSSKYLFSVISSVKRRASIIQEEMTCVFCCLLVF